MKILFYPLINHDKITTHMLQCDYMVDCVFHGLRSLLKENLIDYYRLNHMYNNYDFSKELYGNGFTIFSQLDNISIDRTNLDEKIKNKYFDQIIIPIHHTMHKDNSIIDAVKYFKQFNNNIKVIDGNDNQSIIEEIVDYCVLFKRELLIKPAKNLQPISFGIPKDKIVNNISAKTNEISNIVPSFGGKVNWVHNSEEGYYDEYKNSWFAKTSKKGGWDCLRHYEILANGCIPLFENIEDCPPYTLSNFPKTICKTINKHYNKFTNQTREQIIYFLLLYTKKYLTTEQIAKKVLNY